MRSNDEIAQNLEGLIQIKSQRGPLTRLVTVIRSLPMNFYEFYTTQGYRLPSEIRKLYLSGANREYLFKAIFFLDLVQDEQERKRSSRSKVEPTCRRDQDIIALEREGLPDEW